MCFLLNEASLNVTTFRYCCLGFFLAWESLYLFSDMDAVRRQSLFQVLANTYIFPQLQTFTANDLPICLLIVLWAPVHLILQFLTAFWFLTFPFSILNNNFFFPGLDNFFFPPSSFLILYSTIN